jgi:quercetin dioxygenase-like cupin family protein
MFHQHQEEGYRPAVTGVTMKTLVFGDRTLLTEFRLQAGHTLPRHSHPYEQTGYLVSGSIRLSIGDKTFAVGPGDAWCIPADVEHGAEVLADAVAIEVFSPVRPDYLPDA